MAARRRERMKKTNSFYRDLVSRLVRRLPVDWIGGENEGKKIEKKNTTRMGSKRAAIHRHRVPLCGCVCFFCLFSFILHLFFHHHSASNPTSRDTDSNRADGGLFFCYFRLGYRVFFFSTRVLAMGSVLKGERGRS